MKKMFCVLIISLGLSTPLHSQSAIRYIDSTFTEVQTYTNQVYASAPQLTVPYLGESSTTSVDLTIHIFEPLGDTLKQRPMLVCFHGGGFVSGNKEHDDMIEFCKIFARKGYVTATAQYRLGMNLLSNTSGERAVYRAIQDSRALLRYLRENAVALKISPDHIYILGSSAGAFMALHNVFLNKETERPAGTYLINNFPPTTNNGPDLGSLDAIGSYQTQNSQANGIVSLWGALQDTSLIEAADPNIPVLLIHGTADAIVPFGLGSPFQAPTLTATYGSQTIDKRMTSLSYQHETYFVPGEGHEFYGVVNRNWNPAPNQYWYIVVDKVRDFLFDIHKPAASFDQVVSGAQVTFTNNSTNAIAWHWDFGDGSSSAAQNPVHTYTQSGNYNVILTAYSQVFSTDAATTVVNVTVTSVPEEIPLTTTLRQNYPNPFNPSTTIEYSLRTASKVKIEIYDLLGRLVERIADKVESAGTKRIVWNAKNLSGGMYTIKMVAVDVNGGSYSSFKKLLLLK